MRGCKLAEPKKSLKRKSDKYACDGLRLGCQRSGSVQLHKIDTRFPFKSFSRHLETKQN